MSNFTQMHAVFCHMHSNVLHATSKYYLDLAKSFRKMWAFQSYMYREHTLWMKHLYTAWTFLTSKAGKMYGGCILANTPSKLLQ